ncbi:nuclear transport factor 2 family protein [Actinocrispum wychmicini]|uniref:Actinorhodin biosynthesis protein ActVIA n=1 Tax=Actinocrispum wychmicini TaxID=1213861 RepID=A0A4R2JRC7_9PSEU|nr:nuclear transport factor 2 family protein [Actinocrispum wychmicini]TCO62054.1 actinorhodin biosynthesis protein ActVIA [Actinocrispum wychmicini]
MTDLPELSVRRFYARQMHLLDDGDVTGWAQTFTETGSFASNAMPAAVAGRDAIAKAAGETTAALARDKLRRRHWIGMLAITAGDDDTVRVRSYALVIQTPIGGTPTVLASTTCDDLLVAHGDDWLVADRVIARDDLDGVSP